MGKPLTLLLYNKIALLGLLLLLGWALGRRGILGKDATRGMSRLIIDFTMPALFFSGGLDMDMAQLGQWWPLVPAGFAIGTIGYLFAWPAAKVAAPTEPKKGTFRFIVSVGNTSFLPVPLCWALWGQEGALACLFYVLGSNLFMFTFGVGGLNRAAGRPFNWKLIGLTLFHPQSVGFMLGLGVGALGWSLPKWLLTPVAELGHTTIPLAMVVTGAILAQVHLGKDVDWKLQSWSASLKLLAVPAMALVLLKLWQPAALVAGVIMLQASMPSLASSGIFAERFGGDSAEASAGALVTTLLCPVVLPFWMGMLG